MITSSGDNVVLSEYGLQHEKRDTGAGSDTVDEELALWCERHGRGYVRRRYVVAVGRRLAGLLDTGAAAHASRPAGHVETRMSAIRFLEMTFVVRDEEQRPMRS